MNAGRVATRYARALFEACLEEDMDQKAYVACQRMVKMWYENEDLRTVLVERMVPNAAKVELLEILMNPIRSSVASAFFALLAHENRIDIIANIALIYMDLYRDKHRIAHAEVESARTLTAENRKNIRSWLEQQMPGHAIEMHVQLNPELIGGIRIDLNAKRLDASIAGELIRVGKELNKTKKLSY